MTKPLLQLRQLRRRILVKKAWTNSMPNSVSPYDAMPTRERALKTTVRWAVASRDSTASARPLPHRHQAEGARPHAASTSHHSHLHADSPPQPQPQQPQPQPSPQPSQPQTHQHPHPHPHHSS